MKAQKDLWDLVAELQGVMMTEFGAIRRDPNEWDNFIVNLSTDALSGNVTIDATVRPKFGKFVQHQIILERKDVIDVTIKPHLESWGKDKWMYRKVHGSMSYAIEFSVEILMSELRDNRRMLKKELNNGN